MPLALAPASGADWEGLSEAFTFGGSTDIGPVFLDQVSPAAACDTAVSRTILVVWEDGRAGDTDIFAARLDETGEVLDPASIPVATGLALQTSPAVAVGGGVFLAVWASSGGGEWRIEGARISPEGDLLDPIPLTIARANTPLEEPALAYGGESYLVVWTDVGDDTPEIHGARVSPEGQVLDPEDLLMASDEEVLQNPALACDGSRYLVVWTRIAVEIEIEEEDTTRTEIGEIQGRFVGLSGVVEDTVVVIEDKDAPGEKYSETPALSFSGTDYLVVWRAKDRESSGTKRDMHGRRVTPSGVVDESRIGIRVDRGVRKTPKVASDGRDFLVIWGYTYGHTKGFYGVQVDSTGNPSSSEIMLKGDRSAPSGCALLWNGTDYFAAFSVDQSDDDSDDFDIDATYVSASGDVVGPDITVSLGMPAQVPRCVAFDGSNYLVVWNEKVPGGWMLRGTRVTPEGELLGEEAFTLLPDTLASQWHSSLAYGDSSYALVWAEKSGAAGGLYDIYAVLINLTGEVTTEPLLIDTQAEPGSVPSMSWNGSDFAVAWSYVRSAEHGITMTRLRLEADSLAMVADSLVDVYQGLVSDPAIASDGTNHLVLWTTVEEAEVLGVLLPKETWELLPDPQVIATGEDPTTPRIVFDRGLYYACWEDEGSIYLVRVRSDGLLLDPGRVPLDLETQAGDPPTLASDGHNRIAVWKASGDDIWQLVGTRIGADGSLLDPGQLIFADESIGSHWPVAVQGPDGQILLVYSAFLAGPESNALRIHAKLWQQEPPELTIAIHQNPGVTSDVGILILASESLVEESVSIRANGEPLDLVLTDEVNNIHQGWYHALATDVVNIVATARDSTGNPTEATRSFAIGQIGSIQGGTLAGPFGDIAVTCAPGAVASDSYLMILPEQAWPRSKTAAGEWGFLLSPPGLNLATPARLTVKVPEGSRAAECARPVLERETLAGWEQVPSSWRAADGTLRAWIASLGSFRVRWVEAGSESLTRLSLTLGPDPWRTTLGIRYQLPSSGPVHLAVYDLSGRCVRTLIAGPQEGGWQVAAWNGRDEGDRPVSSGVYFTRLRFGNEMVSGRSLLVR